MEEVKKDLVSSENQRELLSVPLLDTSCIAEFLGLKPGTLAQMRVRGDGPPFIRVGRAIRYDLRDVKQWLESRRAVSTTAADHQAEQEVNHG